MREWFWPAVILKVVLQVFLQKTACEKPLLIGMPCGTLAIAIDVFALYELPLVVYVSAESLPLACCLVYESLHFPMRSKCSSLKPLLSRFFAGLMLLVTAVSTAMATVREDFVLWWKSTSLLLTLILIQCVTFLISFTVILEKKQEYVMVHSTDPRAPCTPQTKIVRVWDKKSQFARVARIALSSCVASTAAQAFLRWMQYSLENDFFQWDLFAISFIILGSTSILHVAKFKRECFRNDFYFGMLAMTQLLSLSSISIIDAIFIHKSELIDFVQPMLIIAAMLLCLFK